MHKSLVIAVDFDGTVVEDRYPEIGRLMPFAVETLKQLERDGHRLVLWTYRHGRRLKEAVAFMEGHGIRFYAVNMSFPGEEEDLKGYSRKIHADLFIDDRNVGGFSGWGEVYQQIARTPLKVEAKRPWWKPGSITDLPEL